eukprot:776357-Prymnesium_polylepis.2
MQTSKHKTAAAMSPQVLMDEKVPQPSDKTNPELPRCRQTCRDYAISVSSWQREQVLGEKPDEWSPFGKVMGEDRASFERELRWPKEARHTGERTLGTLHVGLASGSNKQFELHFISMLFLIVLTVRGDLHSNPCGRVRCPAVVYKRRSAGQHTPPAVSAQLIVIEECCVCAALRSCKNSSRRSAR